MGVPTGSNQLVLVADYTCSIWDEIEAAIVPFGQRIIKTPEQDQICSVAERLVPHLLALRWSSKNDRALVADICRKLRNSCRRRQMKLLLRVDDPEHLPLALQIEYGPDDFLTAPFSAPDLLLRMQFQLRLSNIALDENVVRQTEHPDQLRQLSYRP